MYYDGRGFAAVPVSEGAAFQAGSAARLFDASRYIGRPGPGYDVTPDGQRFLLIRSAEESPASRPQLLLIQNWRNERA